MADAVRQTRHTLHAVETSGSGKLVRQTRHVIFIVHSDDDIPITVANADGPIAATIGGAAVQIDVLANDAGQNLSVTSVTQPAQGSAAVTGGGAHVTYTPPGTGTAGSPTFTYDVTGDNGTGTGTVTIDLAAAPVTGTARPSGLSLGLGLRL